MAPKMKKGQDGKTKRMIQSIIAQSSVPKGVTQSYAERWTAVSGPSIAPGDQGIGFSFQISDLPQVSEITSLYDFYSIDKVEIQFRLVTPPKHTTLGYATYPTLIHAPDYDDSTAPVSRSEVFEYGKNCRVDTFSPTRNVISRTLIPRVSNTVYRTGVSSAYSLAAPGTLVDCTNSDTPHYGVKLWVDNYNSTTYTGGEVAVRVKYWLKLVATR